MKRYPLKTIAKACALSMAFMVTPALAATDKDKLSDIWADATLTTTYALNTQLNPFKIDVDIKQGVAVLRGSVDSKVEKELAEELALGVDGVTRVDNQLVVESSSTSMVQKPGHDKKSAERSFIRKVEDANLTAKVKSQLLWNSSTNGLDINVNTRNGTVTLLGIVESEAQSQLAEQIAHNTRDVYEVINKLKIVKVEKKVPLEVKLERKAEGAIQTISDTWITTKVKSTLLYNRNVDGSLISVQTKDGVVNLSGQVNTEAQRQLAMSISQSIKGVKSVKSNLTIN